MEAVGIQVVILAVFGIVCAMVAKSRGRSPVGWFFVGFFFGCIGLIILLVIPDLKVEEARRHRLEKENRRLREMLRKDRHVSDRRYVETTHRLDVHDQALGVDTSGSLQGNRAPEAIAPASSVGATGSTAGRSETVDAAAGDLASERAASRAAEEAQRALARFTGLTWYYYVQDTQVGPLTFDELKEHWGDGRFEESSLVWNELMQDWCELRSVPLLRESLSA